MRRLQGGEGEVPPRPVSGLAAVVLGVAALVLDIGRAYVVKRQLQSTADAAALAAAGDLPDVSKALNTASVFGPDGKNHRADLDVTQEASVWCLKSEAYCFGNPA